MNPLRFDFEWASVPGSKDPVIGATMADLEIRLGDQSITKVYDRRVQCVRDRVLVSLYPLAEWVAAHWWPLLEENLVPGRTERGPFAEKHSFRHAGDGFALPDLTLVPEGETVLLRCVPLSLEHQPISFQTDLQDYLPKDHVREVLSDLIEAVLERILSANLRGTWLESEWNALRDMDPEEVDFCQAVARMGLDPFDIPDDVRDAVLDAASKLPGSAAEEVFRCASPSSLPGISEWISVGIGKIGASRCRLPDLSPIRSSLGDVRQGLPWERGYQMARDLRSRMALSPEPPLDLRQVLGPDTPVVQAEGPPSRAINALVGARGESAFCCYGDIPALEESRRFLIARALGLCLQTSHPLPGVLSVAVTQEQQQNRAFAAELLAPANSIRQRMRSEMISEDDLDDLSRLFKVSSYVVAHQVRNHRLGTLVDSASFGQRQG